VGFFRTSEFFAALNTNRMVKLPKLKLKSNEQINTMTDPQRAAYIKRIKSEMQRLDWDAIFTRSNWSELNHGRIFDHRPTLKTQMAKLNRRLVDISAQTETLKEELAKLEKY